MSQSPRMRLSLRKGPSTPKRPRRYSQFDFSPATPSSPVHEEDDIQTHIGQILSTILSVKRPSTDGTDTNNPTSDGNTDNTDNTDRTEDDTDNTQTDMNRKNANEFTKTSPSPKFKGSRVSFTLDNLQRKLDFNATPNSQMFSSASLVTGRNLSDSLHDCVHLLKCQNPSFNAKWKHWNMGGIFPFLLLHRSHYIRSCSIRLLRHCVIGYGIIQPLEALKYVKQCHVLLLRSFDSAYAKEKEQVLLLCQACILYLNEIPIGLVRGLLNICQSLKDHHRMHAIEILCSLLCHQDVRHQAHHHVNKLLVRFGKDITNILIATLIDPNVDSRMVDNVMMVLTYLIDKGTTRQYLNFCDAIILPFIQTNLWLEKEPAEIIAIWYQSSRVLVSLISTWPGLLYMGSNMALQTLVRSLSLPIQNVVQTVRVKEKHYQLTKETLELRQEIVLDTIYSMLHMACPKYLIFDTNLFSDWIFASQSEENPTKLPQTVETNRDHINKDIMNQFMTTLLRILIDCDIITILFQCSHSREKARRLLNIMLSLNHLFLIEEQSLQVQDVIDVSIASDLKRHIEYTIDWSDSNKKKAIDPKFDKKTNIYNKLLSKVNQSMHQGFHQYPVIKRGYIENLQHIPVHNILDNGIMNQMIKDSNAYNKDVKKWNWEMITKLLSYGGLDEKFLKRVLIFLRPKKKIFSFLSYKEGNAKYSEIGMLLMNQLIRSERGLQILQQSGFLQEILEFVESNSSDDKIITTLSRSYFEFLGIISMYPAGIALLVDCEVYSHARMWIQSERDQIVQLCIKNFDYKYQNSPSREFLEFAISNGNNKIRYYATLKLRKLIKLRDFDEWGIPILSKLLSDEWSAVAKNALRNLTDAVQYDYRNIVSFLNLDLDPQVIASISKEGLTLLIYILGTEEGIQYYSKNHENWLEGIIKSWNHCQYNVVLEQLIQRSLTNFKNSFRYTPVGVFPHLYESLARTKIGCEVLKSSGLIDNYIETLQDICENCTQRDGIQTSFDLEERSAIWSLSYVLSQPEGYQTFSEDGSVLRYLVDLSLHSDQLSIRGMAMYSLAIASRCELVRGSLEKDFGWKSREGVVLPPLQKLYVFGSFENSQNYQDIVLELPPCQSKVNEKILKLIIEISNPVLQKKSLEYLKELKSTHPTVFKDPELFFRTYFYLSHFHYSLIARITIHKVFDLAIYRDELEKHGVDYYLK